MLVKLSCEKFRVKTLTFHDGLNVVVGDEKAANSIGKSTILMIIDFVFGGESLVVHNKDIVTELGEHDYLFEFMFEGTPFYFKRGTYKSDLVYKCDKDYNEVNTISIDEYRLFLKSAYVLNGIDLTFRSIVSLFSRVWGKDNLDVNQPLHSMKRQSPSDCVDNVLKLMNRYKSIKLLDIRLKELNNKKNAIRNAFKEELIPKITKTQYKNNIIEVTKINSEIEDIKKNLARYAISIREIINRELSELRAKKDSLLKEKSKVDSRLVRVRNDLSQNKFVKSHTFSSLINFFPDVDVDKLTEVEEFHSKISTILKQELRQSESELAHMMDELNVAIDDIDSKLYSSLSNVDNSEVIVDRVHDLAIKYSAIDQEIRYFEAGDKLSGEHTEAKDELAKEKLRVLKITEDTINDKLRQYVNKIYPNVKRRMPELTLAQNSYTYSASEDTGTGKAYSNLILFDLALFEITSLPIVIHDSILYKNVENSAVAEFIKLYISIGKQSFISIDEISKYGDDVKKTILQKQVLKLSDDLLLYNKDWRKEGSSKP